MPRLAPDDRLRLRLIHEAGGKLHIVTARNGQKFPDQAALVRWCNSMCDEDYMRLERISGDENDPRGERAYDFMLTAKAVKAVGGAPSN